MKSNILLALLIIAVSVAFLLFPLAFPTVGQNFSGSTLAAQPDTLAHLGIYRYGIPRADYLTWLDELPYDNRSVVRVVRGRFNRRDYTRIVQ